MSALSEKRILLVEDQFLLALSFQDILEDCGATVVGPFQSVSTALEGISSVSEQLDLALLDVDLSGKSSFPVAQRLTELDIPFLFATGFGRRALAEYPSIPILEKPFTDDELFDALVAILPEPVG
ncbi:response regulator [Litoreibacter roseus]|uniref:Response regulator n=1 Tax=Litoreibacter roseus TaxID=2601869 RepID=A0A6N6JDQ3_9RHOB|nr:response regulator [Litoreibacter roseus]GFE63960.1 response regulator [Litoreibacter roseus]